MTQHLCHKRLCDVLLADTSETSEASSDLLNSDRQHLRGCLICASELELLMGSVSRFRASSIDFADRELTRRRLQTIYAPAYEVHARWQLSHPLSWAAGALVIAVVLPLGLYRHRPVAGPAAASVGNATHSTKSDEALLEGINQALDAAIPSAMQPLDDPTASATASQPTTTQRKK